MYIQLQNIWHETLLFLKCACTVT